MIDVYPPHPAGQARPHAAAVWIDMTAPTPAEVSLVEELTQLRAPSHDDMMQIEQSARISFRDGVFRLTAPVITAATEHPKLTHIGLVMTQQVLLTVHDDPLRMTQGVAEQARDEPAAMSSVALFVALLEAFVARQADLLEEARAHLDGISQQVFRKSADNPRHAARSSMKMREKLQTLGRVGEQTSVIRESLLAVERMIPFVLEAAKDWFDAELTRRLAAVKEDIGSLSLFEEHLLGKVQFLLDAVLGFVGIEQNDIFKVLTIASVVGIFPTLVAGWYGMNFHNMPEYNWAWGYQFGIGAIILSAIIPLAWFKWRGWM
jgi:magnesium transporter